MAESIRVEGLDQLLARMRAEPLFGEHLRKGIMAAALVVESEAKKRAPVDRGQTRAGITHKVDPSPLPLWGTVGTNSPGAAPMEYGTGRNSDGPNASAGHWPPSAPLDAWAKRKGIDVPGFVIARSIAAKGGLKPRRFLRGALDAKRDRVIKLVSGALKAAEREFNGG